MSSPSPNRIDRWSWLQELKGNRRTQLALGALVLVLGYLLWPETPRPRSRPGAGRAVVTPMDERYLESLQKLKDLTQLDQAGELPDEGRMYRDLFLFDMPPPPPPPPPKPIPPPPPPPPPTQAELEAAKLARDRQEATNSRPQTLHYLGYMGRVSTGRIGSFLKGEEIVSLRVGDLASAGWKLVTITETYAEFQHLRFQDIRYRTEARDAQGTASSSPTNQF